MVKIDKDSDHQMTEEEAKKIIRDDPNGDVIKRLEAIGVAESVLGDNCTMEEIWRWAEGGNDGKEKA